MKERYYFYIEERWKMIEELVERQGTENEKKAWKMCQGDATEWKQDARLTQRIRNMVKDTSI